MFNRSDSLETNVQVGGAGPRATCRYT